MSYGADFWWRLAGVGSTLGFGLIGVGTAFGLPPAIWFGTAAVSAAVFAICQAVGMTHDGRKRDVAANATRASVLRELRGIIARGKALALGNPFDMDQYEASYQEYCAWHADARRICAALGREHAIDFSNDVQGGGLKRPNTRVKRWSWVQDRIDAQLKELSDLAKEP